MFEYLLFGLGTSNPMNNSLPLLFPFLFIGFWCAVCILFSRIGDWHKLARAFTASNSPHGKRFYMQSGSVGLINYRSCLNVSVTPDGMFLSVPLIFKLGHPPLFIPWIVISNREDKKTLWYETVKLTIGTPELGSIRLPKKILDGIDVTTPV
jgi:hypothetical protein